ncbi:MAG: hypothetical protein Q8N69_00760 [bacterium]|nr:hypothetical protein [bacterium]
MEKIFYKNVLIGMRLSVMPKGSVPHTDGKQSLELLTQKYPSGFYLKAHVHLPRKRITGCLQECFIVRKGKVRMDLYGPDKKFFKHIYLKAGELFIALSGGHGFHVMEDMEMIELKNGPFEDDKEFIEKSKNH